MLKNILILHENSELREHIAACLASEGYQAHVVLPEGQTIKQVINARMFDLVIADLEEDEARNFKVLRECHEVHPSIPVIFTANCRKYDILLEAIELGLFDCLQLRRLYMQHSCAHRARSRNSPCSAC